MAAQWNYVRNGQALGPLPGDQLKSMLASGTLGWDDLVWREGMDAWTAARLVPELAQAMAPASSAPIAPVPQLAPIQLAPPPDFSSSPNPYTPPRADLQGTLPGDGYQSEVSPGVVEVLRQTKPWARFLAVLGFIGMGFMLLASVAMLALGSSLGRGLPAGFGVGMMLVYVVMAGIQLPAVLFLNRYASRIGSLMDSHAPADLQEALSAQKSFWRYIGILSLIVMCVYILIFVIAVGAGALRGMR